MNALLTSLRLALATWLVCVAGYTGLILGWAHLVTPDAANGSLVTDAGGQIVGSRLIAQRFVQARYFWPRPSAVDFNAAGAGASNRSPHSPDLTARAREAVARLGASLERPAPADLVAASGSGLDPHLTEAGAMHQAARVAAARQLATDRVESLVRQCAFTRGGLLTPDRLVNVLELNLALDRLR